MCILAFEHMYVCLCACVHPATFLDTEHLYNRPLPTLPSSLSHSLSLLSLLSISLYLSLSLSLSLMVHQPKDNKSFVILPPLVCHKSSK